MGSMELLSRCITAFVWIALNPFTQFDAGSLTFRLLERFTVVLYSNNNNTEFVDEARMKLFCRDNKTMENIPSTTDALLRHAKRAAYQASVWISSQDFQQKWPKPEPWGWTWDECTKKWQPVWINQLIASNSWLELIKCACKSEKDCGARCSCKKANWSCTELCKCHCSS